MYNATSLIKEPKRKLNEFICVTKEYWEAYQAWYGKYCQISEKRKILTYWAKYSFPSISPILLDTWLYQDHLQRATKNKEKLVNPQIAIEKFMLE